MPQASPTTQMFHASTTETFQTTPSVQGNMSNMTVSFSFNDDIRPVSFPGSLPAKELYILIKTHYGLDQEDILIVFNHNGSKSLLPKNSSATAYF